MQSKFLKVLNVKITVTNEKIVFEIKSQNKKDKKKGYF